MRHEARPGHAIGGDGLLSESGNAHRFPHECANGRRMPSPPDGDEVDLAPELGLGQSQPQHARMLDRMGWHEGPAQARSNHRHFKAAIEKLVLQLPGICVGKLQLDPGWRAWIEPISSMIWSGATVHIMPSFRTVFLSC